MKAFQYIWMCTLEWVGFWVGNKNVTVKSTAEDVTSTAECLKGKVVSGKSIEIVYTHSTFAKKHYCTYITHAIWWERKKEEEETDWWVQMKQDE